MTRYGVLLREAARRSAGPAGALLCVLMALGWPVGQAWAATADGGGRLPPIADSGGRLPPVADGGGRLPPVADGGARLPPAAGSGGRAWPVAGRGGRVRPVVERGFEPPPEPWAAGHRGVDLGAAPGTEVVAAATGRVSFAGTVAGQGVLSIELTGSGSPPLRITYQPVRPTVAEGAIVVAGRPVGVVGDGPFHCAGGCLHWGLLRGDQYLDPLTLLPPWIRRGGPSRLLPVFGVPAPEAIGGAAAMIADTIRGPRAGPWPPPPP